MEKSMIQVAEEFETYLQMESNVVGIKLHTSENSYQACEFKKYNHAMYYCYMVKLASRGKSIKADKNGMACETGSKVLGLDAYYSDAQGPQGWQAIKVYSHMDLSQAKHEQLKPKGPLNYGISMGPLKAFKNKPDSLILILKPYQAMRLLQAYHYHNQEGIAFKSSGMCGVCYESTQYPIASQTFNLSLLCSGTRFYCKWPEDIMMASLTYEMAHKLLDGLIKTTNPCEVDSKKIKIKANKDLKITKSIRLNENYFK